MSDLSKRLIYFPAYSIGFICGVINLQIIQNTGILGLAIALLVGALAAGIYEDWYRRMLYAPIFMLGFSIGVIILEVLHRAGELSIFLTIGSGFLLSSLYWHWYLRRFKKTPASSQ